MQENFEEISDDIKNEYMQLLKDGFSDWSQRDYW